jgi:hypothetical protein
MKHFQTLSLAVKVGWSLLSIGVLFFTLHLYDGTPSTSDAELILVYGMMTLSFPASLIISIILSVTDYLAGAWGGNLSIPLNHLTIIIEWLVFLGLGYLQWFVFLPWAWYKFRSRKYG